MERQYVAFEFSMNSNLKIQYLRIKREIDLEDVHIDKEIFILLKTPPPPPLPLLLGRSTGIPFLSRMRRASRIFHRWSTSWMDSSVWYIINISLDTFNKFLIHNSCRIIQYPFNYVLGRLVLSGLCVS